MLTLSKRTCQLGDDATSRGKEIEGGEKLRTLTFELEELLLDKSELNSLLAEPHAWDVLFNAKGEQAEPYLKSLKQLELKDPCEGAYVTLTYGVDREVLDLPECKLSKIKLELRDGGDTALSCKVTATPVLDESLAALFEQFGKSIECEVRADVPTSQQDLPLNKFGEGEQSEKPKRGRKGRNGHRAGLN